MEGVDKLYGLVEGLGKRMEGLWGGWFGLVWFDSFGLFFDLCGFELSGDWGGERGRRGGAERGWGGYLFYIFNGSRVDWTG